MAIGATHTAKASLALAFLRVVLLDELTASATAFGRIQVVCAALKPRETLRAYAGTIAFPKLNPRIGKTLACHLM